MDVDQDGIFVELKRGWSFDPHQDNRVASEDTATKALANLIFANPFSGPYTN